MPTYTYKCNGCDVEFDRVLKIADRDTPGKCFDCGSEDIVRTIGNINHAFMAPEMCGQKRPPPVFNEMMNKIKKANKGSDFTTW